MDARNPPPPESVRCANCGETIAASYCGACGQRRFHPQDRRLAHLLREFAHALTDLDGRFWRSMRALLLRPGLLSRDYIAGRRARWMSPVSLFLLANVLYFFAPGMSDFDLPLRDHVRGALVAQYDPAVAALPAERRASIEANAGQLHSRFTEPWVSARLAALAREDPGGSAFAALEQRYAIASANASKALIVLHVPFMALVLLLAMAGRGRYFAEHMVVALHYFAFVLLLFELVVLPGAWLAERAGADAAAGIALRYLLPAALGVYGVIAVRVAYGCGWWRATLAGLALPIALLAINLTIYRALQFALVLALA